MINAPHTWVQINKQAFNHNVAQYKKIIGKGMLAAVVKSNAYGHGLIEIGRMCHEHDDVDWICVALLSEALQLRQYDVKKPILVMTHIDVDLALAVEKNITFFVCNYETALFIDTIGMQKGYVFNVHIKVDTGLTRFGVSVTDVNNFIDRVRSLAYIHITGIATHCAQAQNKDTSFTINQLEKFYRVVQNLTVDIPIKHAANSAATGAFVLPFCNLFRVGLGLYGYWPSSDNKSTVQSKYPDILLKPVLTWKTRIIEIKTIEAGVSVGYMGTFVSPRPMKLGYIPVGYYDGVSPSFSNKATVSIFGCKAPIIGRVAMNVVSVDITDIAHVEIGDEVVLLGDFDGVRADELAVFSELNNARFIMTNINRAIKRVIVSDELTVFDELNNAPFIEINTNIASRGGDIMKNGE